MSAHEKIDRAGLAEAARDVWEQVGFNIRDEVMWQIRLRVDESCRPQRMPILFALADELRGVAP